MLEKSKNQLWRLSTLTDSKKLYRAGKPPRQAIRGKKQAAGNNFDLLKVDSMMGWELQ